MEKVYGIIQDVNCNKRIDVVIKLSLNSPLYKITFSILYSYEMSFSKLHIFINFHMFFFFFKDLYLFLISI